MHCAESQQRAGRTPDENWDSLVPGVTVISKHTLKCSVLSHPVICSRRDTESISTPAGITNLRISQGICLFA